MIALPSDLTDTSNQILINKTTFKCPLKQFFIGQQVSLKICVSAVYLI